MTTPSPDSPASDSRSRGRPVNEDARQARMDQILEGARRCFIRRGFHAASTAEIAAEARVSVANIYQYFASKADLVLALVEQDLADDLALINELDAAASFSAGLDALITGFLSDPDMARSQALRLEIYAEGARDARIAEAMLAANGRLVAALANTLARAQATGELAADFDPQDVADAILGLADGVLACAALQPERMPEYAAMFGRQVRRLTMA